MKKMLKKMFCLVCVFMTIFVAVPFVKSNVYATEEKTDVIGKLYEFGKKSEYEISSSEPVGVTNSENTLGVLSVEGEITETSANGDIPTYEIASDQLITLNYTYTDKLLSASEDEWHLIQDNKKVVNGIELDKKIKHGAIIFQTSLDGEKWTTNSISTDFVKSTGSAQSTKVFQTNDIQLINGCYYRITVAYETEKRIDPSKILFVDTSEYETKKTAEVYQFYASYGDNIINYDSENENKYTLGTLVNAGKDNGYSGKGKIKGDDPHYGWELGNFYVSGYTEKTEEPVFLKNVGDRITLWFNLKQDISKLNGNNDLSIVEDKDGYDQYFQTPKTNFGNGTLIIRHTDYEGVKSEPIIYTNYLEALTSAGADVRVQLFEEGDYEVALNYEIEDTEGFNETHDYRIAFNFKVRNGNCMVYPFDTVTGSELTNSSVTENGFYLDLAKSRYLKVNVTMSRWTKGANGYVEDVRFNRPAEDGESYTDEGIYTIEVSNPTTGKSTTKQIYVGTDSVLVASMNAENSAYTINQIANLVAEGAEIEADGTIIMPEEETTEAVTVFVTETATTVESTTEVTETQSTETTTAITQADDNKGSVLPYIGGGIGAVLLGGAITAYIINKRKETTEESEGRL